MRASILPMFALLCLAASAQEPVQQDQRVSARIQQAEPLVTLRFEGGTLAQFVDSLRQQREGLNILVPDGAERVQVPAMTVKDASVPSVLQAVCDLTESRDVSLGMKSYGGIGQPIYALRVDFRERREVTQHIGRVTERRVHVLSLANLDTSSASVLSAIEGALQGVESEPRPTVRYHASTQLAFIEGTTEAISVAAEVVSAIRATDKKWMQTQAMKYPAGYPNQPIQVPGPQGEAPAREPDEGKEPAEPRKQDSKKQGAK